MCNYFYTVFNGISNKLFNNIMIASNGFSINATALWDTGASNTCISRSAIEKLKLTSDIQISNYSIAGMVQSKLYNVDLYLPNDVIVPNMKVIELTTDFQGFDALIGMDVINLGDFYVSNHNNRTVFGFRYPSISDIDLSK